MGEKKIEILKLEMEILKQEIKKLELLIELEKLKHKEYWQPLISAGDRVPNPLESVC